MIIPPVVRAHTSEHENVEVWEYSQTSGKFRERLLNSTQVSRQRQSKQRQLKLPRFSTVFGMEVAGSTLMAPTPPRPSQSTFHIARKGKEQSCEQMTHFWNGERKQGKYRWVCMWQHDHECVSLFPCDNPSKISRCQQAKRDMAIPTDKTAHFVMVQSQVFAVLKIFFNMPSTPDGRHHLRKHCAFGGEDGVVGVLAGIIDASADEQKVALIILPAVQHGNLCPIEESWAFGPFTHRESVPRDLVWEKRLNQGCFFSSSPLRCLEGNWLIASNRHHVLILMGFEPASQVKVASIHGISDHPGDGNGRLVDSINHLCCQFWFGRFTP